MANAFVSPSDRTLPRVDPGDTVIFRDGMYSRRVLELIQSGIEGAPITYRAEHSWKAILDGENQEGQAISIDSGVGFNIIYGFQIVNYRHGGIGAGSRAHNLVYRNNLIAHIGRHCTDTSGGLVGCRDKDDTIGVTYDRNVFHSIGRLHPGEQGCSPSSGNWKNHDHGIYLRGQQAIISGNVFYNFRSGWCIQLADNANNGAIVGNTFAYPNPNRPGHIVMWERQASWVIDRNTSIAAAQAFIEITGSSPCDEKRDIIVSNNRITASQVLAIPCSQYRLSNNETGVTATFTPPTAPLIPDEGPTPPPPSQPTVYEFAATGRLRLGGGEYLIELDPIRIRQ